MQQRDNLLCKIKKYIDENLNPKNCNFIDSSKDDYEQAPDILDILRELVISENMNIMKLFQFLVMMISKFILSALQIHAL